MKSEFCETPAELRDPNVVWYGPHSCPTCGTRVVRQAIEAGGLYYDAQPADALIYPNVGAGLHCEWTAHTCNRAKGYPRPEPAAREESKEMWAMVELFGHQRIAGKVTPCELGAGALVRIDVPAVGDRAPLTKFYNVKAIYGITPVDKASCERMARDIRAEPISEYSIQAEMRRLKSGSDEDEVDLG